MCGIVGYIGDRDASPVLYGNLKRLEYRGYDSCGIATLDGKIHVKKDTGSVEEINKKVDLASLPGHLGIGHTRWATHGGVTKKNAHPHLDCSGEIVVVHNGIISNFSTLRDLLLKKGHKFKSETDTEVLVHLIEEKYDDGIEKAVRDALMDVAGTYALLVFSTREPDKIICARNESPLVLGIGAGEMYIGSDIASFLKYTKKAVPLDEKEYAVVKKDGYVVKSLATGRKLKKEIMEIDWSDEVAKKDGYAHFMLKEILEQPTSVASSLNVYPEDISKLALMIDDASRVYLCAAGTSLHAAMLGEYWFSSLCNKSVIAMDSSELQNKGVVDGDTLVIGISQSGETYDTLASMRYAKEKGAKIAAIVNVTGSTAARFAEHVIMQGSGIEISVCATKTFTSQAIILLRTALALAKKKKKDVSKIEKELLKLPDILEETIKLKNEIKEISKKYLTVENYIYVGRGINLPSALEGALKLKEITYHHAEGMSGGMLKHGTISLIDKDLNVIAIVPASGENRSKTMSNIQEIKARDGVVVGITSGKPVDGCDANIVAPECGEAISPLVFAPIYQLLAYYTAVNLGRNVDRPRALAKSVTVE
ncbi:glutamine--fructose-6-phosphate transaminase (isomerizing) [archaeon]|nr:glutamine--fructose-6-phosphate transaminase (isomerizing) [archaeon]